MGMDVTSRHQSRPLIALLVANWISRLGNTLAALAIPWFVLSTTGSATSTALAVAVGTIPVVIAGIFGGAIVDRVGYRRSSIISDIASGISTLLIPVLHLTIGLEFWQLLALVFLGAFLDAPGASARRSLFPELVELAGMPLERANAIYSFTGRLASLLGAPIAGILIAILGASNLLFFTTATFVISALIFAAWIPAAELFQHDGESGGFKRYIADVREGFAVLTDDRLLLWLFISFSIGSLVAEPLYAVILQVYVSETYGTAENLGFIFAALAIGSLVGNVLFAAFSQRIPRRGILIGGFLIRALAFTVFVFVPPWGVVAAAIFIGAVALESVNPLYMTLLQERVPAGKRGRVFGVATAIGVSTLPVGIVVYGYLLDRLGLETTLTIFVLANLAVPIAMFVNPSLRDFRPPRNASS